MSRTCGNCSWFEIIKGDMGIFNAQFCLYSVTPTTSDKPGCKVWEERKENSYET